jgi:hypothetical protein
MRKFLRIMGEITIRQPQASGRSVDDLLEADFRTNLKCAIKCRTRSAVTQAQAAIATSLHR